MIGDREIAKMNLRNVNRVTVIRKKKAGAFATISNNHGKKKKKSIISIRMTLYGVGELCLINKLL